MHQYSKNVADTIGNNIIAVFTTLLVIFFIEFYFL